MTFLDGRVRNQRIRLGCDLGLNGKRITTPSISVASFKSAEFSNCFTALFKFTRSLCKPAHRKLFGVQYLAQAYLDMQPWEPENITRDLLITG